MRVAIDAVRETGKLCEAAICYTGNLLAPGNQVHAGLLPGDGPRAQGRRHAHPRHQGHGGPVPAERRVHAGQGAEGRARAAGAFPHPRHLGHRGGERARGGGRGLRRRRRRHRRDDWLHLAAESRLHRRSVALQPARSRHRSRRGARDLDVLGAGAQELSRLRERHALGRLRGVRARHAGRAVHQSQGAGALGRPRRFALARGGADLCRRQRDVRQHRQGDAVVQGGRRHGAADGVRGPHARAGAGSRTSKSRSPSPWCR